MSHNEPPSAIDSLTLTQTPDSQGSVDLLILGLGWTSSFLVPLLLSHITHSCTTRSGHNNTIPFNYDPAKRQPKDSDFSRLPSAKCVLITFPVRGARAMSTLLDLYSRTHKDSEKEGVKWILLGSTLIWKNVGFNDENSEYDRSDERGQAEDALLAQGGDRAVVLDLAGLYGEERQPRNWLVRVAKSRDDVKGKGALHLVHGCDVARAILLSYESLKIEDGKLGGKRWILTDTWSYDWWGLFMKWGAYMREQVAALNEDGAKDKAEGLQYEKWVQELMREEGLRSLPREKARLGRLMDGRAFWDAVGSWPSVGHVSSPVDEAMW